MKNCKTIYIAAVNSDFRTYLTAELEKQPDSAVAGISASGLDVVDQIIKLAPDVVLLDLILPGLDGIGVLQDLQEEKLANEPIIIVMSSFVTELLEARVAALGAQYFLIKPFEARNLMTLLDFEAKKTDKAQDNIDAKITITDMIREMGIPSHVMGFHYTREAIEIVTQAPLSHFVITKDIYPRVAKKYDTTASRVERAIRNAIEVAWLRGDRTAQYELFRNTVSGERGKPTNAEFIMTMADSILVTQDAAHAKVGSSARH